MKRQREPTFQPMLLRAPVPCAWPECHEMTLWRRPSQYKLGTCLDHVVSWSPLTPQGVTLARDIVLDVFEQSELIAHGYTLSARDHDPDELSMVVVHGWWAVLEAPWRFRSVMRPTDAGPCPRCGRLTRRVYGPDAHPLCMKCEAIPCPTTIDR